MRKLFYCTEQSAVSKPSMSVWSFQSATSMSSEPSSCAWSSAGETNPPGAGFLLGRSRASLERRTFHRTFSNISERNLQARRRPRPSRRHPPIRPKGPSALTVGVPRKKRRAKKTIDPRSGRVRPPGTAPRTTCKSRGSPSHSSGCTTSRQICSYGLYGYGLYSYGPPGRTTSRPRAARSAGTERPSLPVKNISSPSQGTPTANAE